MYRITFISFLVALTIWGVSPHQSCFCGQKIALTSAHLEPYSAADHHACCHVQGTARCSDSGSMLQGSTTSISTVTPCCCGSNSWGQPATSVSIAIHPEQKIVLRQILCSQALKLDFPHALLSRANRSPPYMSGFGSLKTYLFKQVLLI